MTRLSENSVNLAKKHIQHYQDSDFYQKELEFKALFDNWETVKTYLLEKNLTDFQVFKPRFDYYPKARGGYRRIHQLDPLDALIYTAIGFEVGDTVEQLRCHRDENNACSYHVHINSKGNFFRTGTGYRNFLSRCTQLAKKYDYVAMTDISDFYNQINVDSLSKTLAVLDPKLSKEISDFLLKLNSHQTKGLPVGPAASIVLSEALMIGIDNFLRSKNSQFVRFVDDFRIFSNSELKLKELLTEFETYLLENYKLHLVKAKTHIMPSRLYLHIMETGHHHFLKESGAYALSSSLVSLSAYTALTNSYQNFAYDDFSRDNFSGADKKILQNEQSLYSLLEKLMQDKLLNVGLSRYILQQCKLLKTEVIANKILTNFDYFSPVMRDVILYLNSVTHSAFIEKNKEQVIQIINHSKSLKNSFVKSWFDTYLIKHKDFYQIPQIQTYLKSASIRHQALLAVKHHALHWTRQHKLELDHHRVSDKRAIIYSAKTLPETEKNNWLRTVRLHHPDLVTDLVAKWVREH
jgi:hypothetical protein